MGTFAKDTYDTASRAALVGGTTTLIEMVCPSRRRRSAGSLRAVEITSGRTFGVRLRLSHGRDALRREDARNAAANRRRRHGVVQSLPRLQGRLRHRRRRTVPNAWSWPGDWASSSPPTAKTPRLVAQLQQRLLAEGKTGPEWHEPSRPPAVEAEGVHHLATFAELTGAHVYVVHTSCAEALASARAAARARRARCGSRR